METFILKTNSKKDLDLILEFARKKGLNLTVVTQESPAEKRKRLIELAEISDASIIENDITMDEIVEEVRLVREERKKYEK